MKMYVLVRKDLGMPYKYVQGIHATSVLSSDFYNSCNFEKTTAIVVEVRNEKELMLWRDKMDYFKVDHSYFLEPDLNNQLTSVACLSSDEEFFKSLPLAE